MKYFGTKIIVLICFYGVIFGIHAEKTGRINIQVNSQESGQDKITVLNAALDSSSDFSNINPETQSLAVVIAGNKISLDSGTWHQKGYKWTYTSDKSQSQKIKFQLDCNKKPNQWSLRAASLTLDRIDSSVGTAVYLEIDGKSYGSTYMLSEKGNWKFNSQEHFSQGLEITGEAMNDFEIEQASIKYNSAKEDSLQLSVDKGIIELSSAFDYQNDAVRIIIDSLNIYFPPNSFVKHKSKNTYTCKNKNYGVSMNLNLENSSWNLKIKNFPQSLINLSDGLDFYMTIGSQQEALNLNGSNQKKIGFKPRQTIVSLS